MAFPEAVWVPGFRSTETAREGRVGKRESQKEPFQLCGFESRHLHHFAVGVGSKPPCGEFHRERGACSNPRTWIQVRMG